MLQFHNLLELHWYNFDIIIFNMKEFYLPILEVKVDTATHKEKSIEVHNVIWIIVNGTVFYPDLRLEKLAETFVSSTCIRMRWRMKERVRFKTHIEKSFPIVIPLWVIDVIKFTVQFLKCQRELYSLLDYRISKNFIYKMASHSHIYIVYCTSFEDESI